MSAPIQRPKPFFVGDHLAMDFLNTLANPADRSVEWLSNGVDLIDWLEQAGAIDQKVAATFRADGNTPALDAVAGQARQLREWLRALLRNRCAIGPAALAPLNDVLAQDNSYGEVVVAKGQAPKGGGTHQHLVVRRSTRWSVPDQLLQPIASAIADLICEEDLRLVRTCEGPTCTLTFLDRTKAHARRWCSMAVCGNRAKAAAHRARAAHRHA